MKGITVEHDGFYITRRTYTAYVSLDLTDVQLHDASVAEFTRTHPRLTPHMRTRLLNDCRNARANERKDK